MTFESPESQMQIRVYIEDTDAGGIVYHANYLKFMERARTDWLRSLGYEHCQAVQSDYILVVRKMMLDYQRPATMDDLVTVRSRLLSLRGAGLTLQQQVCLAEQCLVDARVELVSVRESSKRPCALPKSLQQTLTPLLAPARQ